MHSTKLSLRLGLQVVVPGELQERRLQSMQMELLECQFESRLSDLLVLGPNLINDKWGPVCCSDISV